MLRLTVSRLEAQLSVSSAQGAMRNSKYGRSEPAPLVPFERLRSTRGHISSAQALPRAKVPPPAQWKGIFNDHGALEEWVHRAAGYLETAVGIFRHEALDDTAVKYHVESLFSSVEENGTSTASWVRMKLEMVVPGVPYTLDDLFNDMRLFWTDPKFEERELNKLLTMTQGQDTANVFLSKFLQVTRRLRSSILSDHMVHRVFVAGLHPVAKQYVEDQIRLFEDNFLETGRGEPVPSLEKIARWAGARDDKVLAPPSRFPPSSSFSAPSQPSASRSLAPPAPVPFSTRPAPKASEGLLSKIPSTSRSPLNSKDAWERRAREFQSRFPVEDRKNWPPARDSPPPPHFQCWNCGRTGHWSVACTHARVDPRVAAAQLASVQVAVAYCDLWEETEDVDYEFEAYGVVGQADEEDPVSLDDSPLFA